jgi:O-antigen/teichoic acid export membrane protein
VLTLIGFNWFDLKTFLRFLGGNMIFQLVTFVSELIILGLVDVSAVGAWQLALLFQGYVIISRLGIINSFNREYIFLLSKSRNNLAKAVLDTTNAHVAMSMLFQFLFFVGMTIYFLFIGSNKAMVIAFSGMAIYTVLDAATNFAEARSTANNEFNTISKGKILASITSILLLLFPYYLGLSGLVLRLIGVQLSMLLFLNRFLPKLSLINFRKKIWFMLFSDGWKLWIWSYSKGLNRSLPRLFLVYLSSITILGLFTPVNWILLSITLFTNSLSIYLYPLLTKQYAKGDMDISRKALKINFLTFFLLSPFVVCVCFLVEPFINWFLPLYSESIFAMRVVAIASLFEIFSITSSSWVAAKNWKKMFIDVFGNMLIRLGCLSWLFFYEGNILDGIAQSILAGSVLSGLFMIILVYTENKLYEEKTAILLV